MNKVLFVTYGAGHAEIVLSLLPRLKALGIEIGILALTTAAKSLQHEGYTFTTCSDYLGVTGYEEAINIGAQLSNGIWRPESGISWIDSCAYMGVSMVDLITDYGSDTAWRLYSERGRRAFCPTHFMQRVLEREQPQWVVTTCHVRMERAAVLAARQLGCRSLLIEDLFGYSLLGESNIRTTSKPPPCSEWPDDVIVLNQQVKDRLVRAGFPAAAVHPLGQPAFSDWVTRFNGAAPCKALADWYRQGIPVVTYASPARHDVLQRHLAAMLQIAINNPAWGIVVKLHPSVAVADVQGELIHQPANLRLLSGDTDCLPVVKASDLIIVFRSTVGMFALFAGLPLLVFDDSGEPDVMPYVSCGAAVGVSTATELEQAIIEQLTADAQGGAPAGHPLFETPPQAPERIAAWLHSRL